MNKYGVYVAGVEEGAVSASVEAIMQILSTPTDEKTKRAALKVLGQSCTAPSHLSFNSMNVDQSDVTPPVVEDDLTDYDIDEE